jgi:high-affinity nickel-transport protein
MSLLDTIDGSFMSFAYGRASSKPVRKVSYNLTITDLSVAVALVIGTIELLGLLADKLHLHGAFWDWVAGLDLNTVGFITVGLFFATWILALMMCRLARIEEKWTTVLRPADQVAD